MAPSKDIGKGKAPATASSSKGRIKTPAPPPSPDMQPRTSDPCCPGRPVYPRTNNGLIPTRRHFLRRRYKELWGRLNKKLFGKKAAASSPWINVYEESDSSSDGTIPEDWATSNPKVSSDRSGDENNTGSRDGKDDGVRDLDPPNDHISFRYGKGLMESKAGERSKEPETTQPSEESQTEESSKEPRTEQTPEEANTAESSKEPKITTSGEGSKIPRSSKESKKTTLREISKIPRRKSV